MDPISTVTAALSTAAGKAVAVAVVGVASVTGLQASGLAEVPGFADTPGDVVVVDDAPQGAEHAKTPAEADTGDDEAGATETVTEAEETEGAESEAGAEGAEHASEDHADFGQTTAADARDGGVVGQDIAEAAKTKANPSDDRPEAPVAPADVRQDEAARAEHAPAGDDDAEDGGELEDETDDDGTPAPQAEEHRAEAASTARP